MTFAARQRWASAAVTLIAIAAMAWVVRAVDWPAAWATWQRVPLHVWLVSAGGLQLSHVLRAGRVRAEWRERLDMGWREAWGLMVRHSAWVVLIPMRGGEAIYVWALHRQGGVSIGQASISLLRLRVQDMAVLGALSLALFAPIAAELAWLAAIALVAAAFWALPLAWQWLMHRMSRHPTDRPFQMPPPAWESWIFAITNWIVKACAIAWPLWVMLPIDGRNALQGALGGELAASMPLQPPAGFGPYEAGVIFGVQWASTLPWPDIAASALAVHLLALAVTLGSALLARFLGWSQSDLKRLDGATTPLSS